MQSYFLISIHVLCCIDINYQIKISIVRAHTLPRPKDTYFYKLCLSFNRMVEPSPPAVHQLSGGDVSMAGVGVKIEQEESREGGGLMTNTEPLKTSPTRDWSGNHPLEARQLTPPLSCSPSVRQSTVRKVPKGVCGKFRRPYQKMYLNQASFLFC